MSLLNESKINEILERCKIICELTYWFQNVEDSKYEMKEIFSKSMEIFEFVSGHKIDVKVIGETSYNFDYDPFLLLMVFYYLIYEKISHTSSDQHVKCEIILKNILENKINNKISTELSIIIGNISPDDELISQVNDFTLMDSLEDNTELKNYLITKMIIQKVFQGNLELGKQNDAYIWKIRFPVTV